MNFGHVGCNDNCTTPCTDVRTDAPIVYDKNDEENDPILKKVLELSLKEARDISDTKETVSCKSIDIDGCMPREDASCPTPVKRGIDDLGGPRHFFDDNTHLDDLTDNDTSNSNLYDRILDVAYESSPEEKQEIDRMPTGFMICSDTSDDEHIKCEDTPTVPFLTSGVKNYEIDCTRDESLSTNDSDKIVHSVSTSSSHKSDWYKRCRDEPDHERPRDADDFLQVFQFDHAQNTYVGFCDTISTETLTEHGKKSRKKQTFVDHIDKIIFAAKIYSRNKHIVETMSDYISEHDISHLSVSKIRKQCVQNTHIVDIATSMKECKQKVGKISQNPQCRRNTPTRRTTTSSPILSHNTPLPTTRLRDDKSELFRRMHARKYQSFSHTPYPTGYVPFEKQANAGAGIDPKHANIQFHPPEYRLKAMGYNAH